MGSGTSGSRYNPFKVRLAARNSVYLNYKNMPAGQLLVNAPLIAAGVLVKYGFFRKLGFGREYLAGMKEGLATMRKCRKVPYAPDRLVNYLSIQWELTAGTAVYVYEFLARQLKKAAIVTKN